MKCPTPGGTCQCVSPTTLCSRNNHCYTPATQCCLDSNCTAANASNSCSTTTNTCSYICFTNFYDLDGSASNGCECQDDVSGAGDCSTAIDMGTVPAGGSAALKTGHLPLANEVKWYKVNFSSVTTPSNHPVISLTSDDGSVRFDIVRGCPVSGALTCGGGEGNSTAKVTWEQQLNQLPNPTKDQTGNGGGGYPSCPTARCNTCTCSTPYSPMPAPGLLYIKVYRVGGLATACPQYRLSATD
jgi:hypothetical protein